MFDTQEEWYDACVEKQKSGDLDGAITMLNELLEKYPENALAHAALGVYYSRKGLIDESIEHCKKYCQFEPEDSFGYSILSSMCIKLGRREEAEDALFKARDLQIQQAMAARNGG